VSVWIFISVFLTSVTLRVQNQIGRRGSKEGGGAKEEKRREREEGGRKKESGREEGGRNGWKKERRGWEGGMKEEWKEGGEEERRKDGKKEWIPCFCTLSVSGKHAESQDFNLDTFNNVTKVEEMKTCIICLAEMRFAVYLAQSSKWQGRRGYCSYVADHLSQHTIVQDNKIIKTLKIHNLGLFLIV
jgi:hypothetical protein